MPATQTSLKRERTIEAIVAGAGSISEAGRIGGYGTVQATHRALNSAEGQRQLEIARARARDRTHDVLSKFERIVAKCARAVDSIDERQLHDDPTMAAGLIKILGEARRVEHEIRDKYGIRADAERIAEGRKMYSERMQRWASIAIRATVKWNTEASSHLDRLARIALRIVPEHARM